MSEKDHLVILGSKPFHPISIFWKFEFIFP